MGEGFGARESVDEEESEDEQELRAFIEGLWARWPGDEWTVGDVKALAMNPGWADHIMSILPASVVEKRDPWKSLGHYLKSHNRQFAGDKRLIRGEEKRGGVRWRIEQAAV
jgi:hypothetical protein